MRYHNRYAREDGQWKFADRQLEVVWTEARKVKPFEPGHDGPRAEGLLNRGFVPLFCRAEVLTGRN
jgi:hypothetical protein